MATEKLLYDKQIKFEGNAYLDPKHMPVESFSALLNLPSNKLFEGMEVIVLCDETMQGETTRYTYHNNMWVPSCLTSEILDEEPEPLS